MTCVAAQAQSAERDEYSEFADGVIAWSTTHARARDELPWRRTDDPWAVLISELMLAQTQVERVAKRFPDFLQRFPSPQACVDSSPGDVVREWSGLGYNRRAIALHTAATQIVERHGGTVPRDLASLMELSGVGGYTARAVLAFAFNERVGVVDVNIRRVIGRAVVGHAVSPSYQQRVADQLVVGRDPRSWNLALMDFGSLVCKARAPACGACPLAPTCAWRRFGATEDPGAACSRQSRFEGSDRQGRGRLLRAVCEGPVDEAALAAALGWPDDPERAGRVTDDLISEGLIVFDGRRYRLP